MFRALQIRLIDDKYHQRAVNIALRIDISWSWFVQSDGGVMVSIVAFQAVDPGSIPGHRMTFTAAESDT